MRPKKRILLIDKNEVRRSCTAFQLHIWNFAVVQRGEADLVLAFAPFNERQVARLAFEKDCHSLVIWHGKGIVGTTFTRILVAPQPGLLREAIKDLTAGKRGPVPNEVKLAREAMLARFRINHHATGDGVVAEEKWPAE